MKEILPSVTVVIAARPGQAELKAAVPSRHLDYPADKLEILIARGTQPSVQRNAALKAARGDLIYFLDDDSVPAPGNLRRAVAHFRQSDVVMVGGPNLCPAEAPQVERVFALVLASWLAFGPSRARYAAVGGVRPTSEKELILCNLIARRGALVDLGGFNEALYPNEENALMDELQQRGGKLIYDPKCVVQRRPRPSLRAFIKMLLTYGRGRAEQFRVKPTLGSALNFAPPLFCLWLVFSAAVTLARPGLTLPLLTPLAAYALIVLAQAGATAVAAKSLWGLATAPLIVLTHLCYGIGFWRGLFTPLGRSAQRSPPPVVIELVKATRDVDEDQPLDKTH